MFGKSEMNNLDMDYFHVLLRTAYHIQVQSKNTKHIWDIESNSVFHGKRSIIIHHKHNEKDPFHEQQRMHPKTIVEAQDMIKKHDEWHMNGRNSYSLVEKNKL